MNIWISVDKEGWGSRDECFDNNLTSLYGSPTRKDENVILSGQTQYKHV